VLDHDSCVCSRTVLCYAPTFGFVRYTGIVLAWRHKIRGEYIVYRTSRKKWYLAPQYRNHSQFLPQFQHSRVGGKKKSKKKLNSRREKLVNKKIIPHYKNSHT